MSTDETPPPSADAFPQAAEDESSAQGTSLGQETQAGGSVPSRDWADLDEAEKNQVLKQALLREQQKIQALLLDDKLTGMGPQAHWPEGLAEVAAVVRRESGITPARQAPAQQDLTKKVDAAQKGLMSRSMSRSTRLPRFQTVLFFESVAVQRAFESWLGSWGREDFEARAAQIDVSCHLDPGEGCFLFQEGRSEEGQ